MRTISVHTTDQRSVVEAVCATLAAGGLILFPTETTYGAGVDATNQTAVDKLLAYKSRREGKPLSIAVADEATAAQFVEVSDQAHALYAQFLPGPVTVVSKSLGRVAQGVESEFGTLGVRIPDHQLMLEICRAYGKPITATGANGSGKKLPYSIPDIMSGISDKQKALIDLVLDAGELPHNPPSTVIDTTLSAPVTMRAGAVSIAPSESSDKTSLISNSEQETKAIAGRILLKNWDRVGKTGLIIGLDGALGMGKTIFAKGVAEFLQISEMLASPTYTYIEEYPYTRHQTAGKLYHLDMWKVDSQELFDRLEVTLLLKPGNVVVIEWFSQVAGYFDAQQARDAVRVQFTQQGQKRMLKIAQAM